jgi:hypothetical protein
MAFQLNRQHQRANRPPDRTVLMSTDACDPSKKGFPRPITVRNGEEIPVPFVALTCADLRTLDNGGRVRECELNRLCQVCGTTITDAGAYGIPRDGGFNGNSLMHRGCLVLSLANCPELRDRIIKGTLRILREPENSRYKVKRAGANSGNLDFQSVEWIHIVEQTAPDTEKPERSHVKRAANTRRTVDQLREHFYPKELQEMHIAGHFNLTVTGHPWITVAIDEIPGAQHQTHSHDRVEATARSVLLYIGILGETEIATFTIPG